MHQGSHSPMRNTTSPKMKGIPTAFDTESAALVDPLPRTSFPIGEGKGGGVLTVHHHLVLQLVVFILTNYLYIVRGELHRFKGLGT